MPAPSFEPAGGARLMSNSGQEAGPTYRSGTQSVEANGGEATPEERGAALKFLQQLATELSQGTVDLPCFPNVVVRISEALMDPRTTPDKVVTVVGAEPRLAARVLQTANSAALNVAGKPVAELRTAIIRIGQSMLQSIAISYAIEQMQYEESLRAIAKPLATLWDRCIAVATLCQVLAARTKISPDEAFLTGLLHGIGHLYIMARAVGRGIDFEKQHALVSLLESWHASIGKAVLESWGFSEELCDAIADQRDYERRRKHEPGLTDVLIVAIVLSDLRHMPPPRQISTAGINAFASLALNPADCEETLAQAEHRIALVHEALK
jgi:HD-like signal output (HDOD) protein